MSATYEHNKPSDMKTGLPPIDHNTTHHLGLPSYHTSNPVTIPQSTRHNRHPRKNIPSVDHNTNCGFPILGEDTDELSPLPEDLNHLINAHSPKNSPPVLFRQRSQTIDATFHPKTFNRTKSNPVSILPKDPEQPKMGSIGNIHADHKENNEENEEEEDDFFSELTPMRSRSQTCPESILHKRRIKVRSLRRPSTPPPADLLDDMTRLKIPKDIEQEIDRLVKLGGS